MHELLFVGRLVVLLLSRSMQCSCLDASKAGPEQLRGFTACCRISELPQWAISGESFPVGCRFDPNIAFSHFFSVNPDRRCRLYSSAFGAYAEGENNLPISTFI